MGASSLPSVPNVWSLIEDVRFIGAGMYASAEGKFLFGLRPPKGGEQGGRLQVTLVGGAREHMDPSLTATVMREAFEETRSGVVLYQSERTLVVYSESDVRWVTIRGAERPALVLYRYNDKPGGDPFKEGHGNLGCIVVFVGELLQPVRPCAEHPGFVWLTPEQIIRLVHEDVPLGEMLDEGMPLKEMWPGILDRHATLRLTDSQEALVIALGPGAPRFYASLLSAADPSS